jgi:hypothetical protein
MDRQVLHAEEAESRNRWRTALEAGTNIPPVAGLVASLQATGIIRPLTVAIVTGTTLVESSPPVGAFSRRRLPILEAI